MPQYIIPNNTPKIPPKNAPTGVVHLLNTFENASIKNNIIIANKT